MSDFQHEPLDTAAARIHELAGSLYYVASLNGAVESERHFSALPRGDQQYFEQLVRQALEAAASWRPSVDRQPPMRRAISLVPRLEAR